MGRISPALIEALITAIKGGARSAKDLPSNLRLRLQRDRVSIDALINQIEAGEREADARLAAAIDSLQPSMDYHSYSSS